MSTLTRNSIASPLRRFTRRILNALICSSGVNRGLSLFSGLFSKAYCLFFSVSSFTEIRNYAIRMNKPKSSQRVTTNSKKIFNFKFLLLGQFLIENRCGFFNSRRSSVSSLLLTALLMNCASNIQTKTSRLDYLIETEIVQ